MITLEEAKAIADTRLADITECTETTNAYIFVNPRTKYSIGGPDAAVIVLKEDGHIIPSVDYYANMAGKEIGTIKFVTYVEPASYFTPEMLKVAEEYSDENGTIDSDENVSNYAGKGTGFAAPMRGKIYPKGSKIIPNEDGTVSVMPPDKSSKWGN